MKVLRFFLILLAILGLAALILWATGHSYLFKGAWATYLHGKTTTSISDVRFFDHREVPATDPSEWAISKSFNEMELSDTLRDTLEATETVAFLVVKNDSILYEEYWDGYSDTSHSNSFSAAKSITTMLAQKAIEEGHINSWEDKVIDYLPEIQGPYREDLRLEHLSKMTSGLKWGEHYSNPFGITARAYYSSDVKEVMYEHVPVVVEPGSEYQYQSGAPQLLGMVVAKATGQTVSEYASENFWGPMGAEETAWWHLDDEGGMELTYCCFNSNARDFARWGKLLIHHGSWNGEQLIDSSFLAKATTGAKVPHYGWSFWVYDDFSQEVYYMRGMHGQYIIVIPEEDLVVVRLGRTNIKKGATHAEDFKLIVEEVVENF